MVQTTEELISEVKQTSAELAAYDMREMYGDFPMLFVKSRQMHNGFPVWSARKAPDSVKLSGEKKWSTAYEKALELRAKWEQLRLDDMFPEVTIKVKRYTILFDYDVAKAVVLSGMLVTLLARGWVINIE